MKGNPAFSRYTVVSMPRVLQAQPAAPQRGKESIGQCVARICKERGFIQVDLVAKVGIVQTSMLEQIPHRLQTTLPRTIDTFFEVAALATARRA